MYSNILHYKQRKEIYTPFIISDHCILSSMLVFMKSGHILKNSHNMRYYLHSCIFCKPYKNTAFFDELYNLNTNAFFQNVKSFSNSSSPLDDIAEESLEILKVDLENALVSAMTTVMYAVVIDALT